MAYHPNATLAELPAIEIPAAAPVDPLSDLEAFAPISHVLYGPGDDTLTTIDEMLAPVETVTLLVDVTPDTETVVIDLSVTDPTPTTTDSTLIPVENTTLVPTVATLPLMDGTDYVD